MHKTTRQETPQQNKPLTILPDALVCCQMDDIITSPNSGRIFIGDKTIIHPKCTIESGPNSGGIYIGQFNIIEDKVRIVNYSPKELLIGNYNWIQSGCVIDSSIIGSRNTLEPRVQVHKGSEIENDCHIGANCVVLTTQPVKCNTSIHGSNCERVVHQFNDPHSTLVQEQHIKLMDAQIGLLCKIMAPMNVGSRNRNL